MVFIELHPDTLQHIPLQHRTLIFFSDKCAAFSLHVGGMGFKKMYNNKDSMVIIQHNANTNNSTW